MKSEKNTISRRTFLTGSTAGMASVGCLGFSKKSFPEICTNSQDTVVEPEIITRTLGSTNIQVPIVNMGVMNSMDPALVKSAFKKGVRYFDTAAWYQRGGNEKMLGQAIQDLKARERVILGTKVYIPHQQRTMRPEKAKEEYIRIANESLERLQTDYVDILYSHNVSTLEWLNNPGIIEALKLLKTEGKTRFIGFTTHSNMTECIQSAVLNREYDVIETAYNFAMADDHNLSDSLKQASEKGIGLIAMKTQCSQYWYREHVPESGQRFYEGKIMHTAVLKWALRNPMITTAIPGFTTYQQLDEDFVVARNLDYTPDEKAFLEDRNVKLSLNYCLQCGHCVSTCPRRVDIPTLMRTHLYAACYSNFYQARDALDSIPKNQNLDSCSACDICMAICLHHIDISRRINALKCIFA